MKHKTVQAAADLIVCWALEEMLLAPDSVLRTALTTATRHLNDPDEDVSVEAVALYRDDVLRFAAERAAEIVHRYDLDRFQT